MTAILIVMGYLLPVIGLLAVAVLVGALVFLLGYSLVERVRERKPAAARVAASEPS